MSKFIKNINLALVISVILFIVPFFWLKSGEMDIGGDSSRLYFYDPISFLKFSLYGISSYGMGGVEPFYYYIPFVGLLALLKSTGLSSTDLINLSNGAKLSVGFLSMYYIVFELLKLCWGEKNNKALVSAAILAGVFYISSLGTHHTEFFWNTAIMSHNQVFLNPLIFFLILKFLITHEYKYLIAFLFASFVFSSNFGFTSVPPFFAFYPIAILFLFSYMSMFGKKHIPWRRVFIGIVLFLGFQAFHWLAQAISLFDTGSFSNKKVFSKEEIEAGGVFYFTSVAPHGKAVLSFLLPSKVHFLQLLSIIAPVVIIIGFVLDKSRKKEPLFIAFFFVVTFFLVTANITNIGFEFYRKLFYIPGFSMFRVFFAQWIYVFLFFYSLLVGFSLFNIFLRLRKKYATILCYFIFFAFLLIGIPLISGTLVNGKIIRASNNVKNVMIMDPHYEETLEFIRGLPDDGKFMVLPLTDFFRQVVSGTNGGAYEGPSTLQHLTTKYSFVGYQHFGYGKENGKDLPYAEDLMRYSREKDYNKLLRIFSTLNIRYILHNTDPKAYEVGYIPGSYGYMMTSLPKTQSEYVDFLKHFPLSIIYKNGPFIIYEIDKSAYNPFIFIPDGVYKSDVLLFDSKLTHSVFLNKQTCEDKKVKNLCDGQYKKSNAKISFKMIDPTVYKVDVSQFSKTENLFLVMQNSFHRSWKVVLNDKYLAEDSRILVNGYANGWIISGKDLPENNKYSFYIKLDSQKYFWYGWFITGVCMAIVIGFISFLIFKKNGKN